MLSLEFSDHYSPDDLSIESDILASFKLLLFYHLLVSSVIDACVYLSHYTASFLRKRLFVF